MGSRSFFSATFPKYHLTRLVLEKVSHLRAWRWKILSSTTTWLWTLRSGWVLATSSMTPSKLALSMEEIAHRKCKCPIQDKKWAIPLVLKKCTFHRHFENFSSASYGNCFTFNSKFAESGSGEIHKSTLPGASLGLNLVISILCYFVHCFNSQVVNLDQRQYMDKGITQSAGAR